MFENSQMSQGFQYGLVSVTESLQKSKVPDFGPKVVRSLPYKGPNKGPPSLKTSICLNGP